MKRVSIEFWTEEHPELGDVSDRIGEIAVKAVMGVYLSNGVLKDWRYTVDDGLPSPSPSEDSPSLPD